MSWKLSGITLVYKQRGSVTDLHFYRPIAVLPTLAMVFERVVYSQIYHHIFPFIPTSQFGFMTGTGAQNCGTVVLAVLIIDCGYQLVGQLFQLPIPIIGKSVNINHY